MEAGTAKLAMYLSVDQYYLLYRDAAYCCLASACKDTFGNAHIGSCNGDHDGCAAKEIQQLAL